MIFTFEDEILEAYDLAKLYGFINSAPHASTPPVLLLATEPENSIFAEAFDSVMNETKGEHT